MGAKDLLFLKLFEYKRMTEKFICKRGCAQTPFPVYNSEVLEG